MAILDRMRVDFTAAGNGEWLDARFWDNIAVEVNETGSITAASVKIEGRASTSDMDTAIALGQTDVTPLGLGDQLHLDGETQRQVRAVVNSITGSGTLHVWFIGRGQS